jgi:hypothetical protein
MKNLFPRLSRITLKDWLEYHPYDREVSSDHFYIGLSNDIQHEMLHIDVNDNLVGADYKYLACMLTCYFEDIVSQTGMWTSFIDEHHRLYGKYLPFYDMAGYEHGDVNLSDIQFLIWHFCSNLSIQNHFIDPFSIENTEIAKIVYTMLNETAGQAPRNEDLKAALTLAPDADFGKVKRLLDFFFFGCYLQQYYMTSLLEGEILDVKNQKGSQKNFDQLVADRRAHLLFNRVSPLLAQRSNEMLAHWAGESHPLYKKLLTLSKRKEGFFLYEGATATHLQMKHFASGILVELNNPNWDFPLVEGNTLVRAGIAQWDGEWYATGPAFPVEDPKTVEITEKDKCLFAPVASHAGVVKREEECFLEVNHNKRILFLESKREAFTFIDTVWETYHLKYGMESMDRKMFDVHDATFEVDDDLENLVVFFNPRAGMEFYSDIAQCISVWDNPYFDKDAETNIEDLMLDERISSDFISFLIDNRMIEIEPTVGKGGFHYVWANCYFLLRYWKRERYMSEPKLFVE